jgi:hypothetical protein
MKRIRLAIVLAAVVIMGSLAFVASRPREPRYEGRTLTEWIGDALNAQVRNVGSPASNLTNDPTWLSANRAVKQMAPEAVPWLLRLLQVKDSSLKRNVARWLDDYPRLRLRLHIRADYDDVLVAVQGLSLLGDDAKAAWPVVLQLAQSPDSSMRLRALWCLGESKLDKQTLMPVLLRLLRDRDSTVQYMTAIYLNTHYPQEAEAAGVYKMFPQLKTKPTEQTDKNKAQ